MAELTDHELLTAFARTGTESAFATLVQRHINLVYSTAKRFTDDDTLAGDITQAVFILLARKAGGISAKTILTGWLYQTARLLAANALKQKIRRQNREQEAYMQSTLNQNETDAAWKQIAPVLDDAMGALGETDRNAVLLRYFEDKPLAAVGEALGVSEDAARVRVNRALEKLRTLMTRKGVTLGATAIAGAVTAKAVTVAPVALATTIISTAAVTGTTLTLTAIAMTTFQKIAVAAALTVTVGAGIFEAKQAHDAQKQMTRLQAQQAPMQVQIEQLQNDLAGASNTITGLKDDFAKNRKDNEELLALRGKVGQLQAQYEMLKQSSQTVTAQDNNDLDSLVGRINFLKLQLSKHPEWAIYEIQDLNEQEWTMIARTSFRIKSPEDEDGIRQTLGTVRQRAKMGFANRLHGALKSYAADSSGGLPADVSALKSYLDQQRVPYQPDGLRRFSADGRILMPYETQRQNYRPTDEALFQRYKMVASGTTNSLHPNQYVIAEKSPVDELYDTIMKVGMDNSITIGTGKDHSFGHSGVPDMADITPGQLEIYNLSLTNTTAVNQSEISKINNRIDAEIMNLNRQRSAEISAYMQRSNGLTRPYLPPNKNFTNDPNQSGAAESNDPDRTACIKNLRMIDAAKNEFAFDHNLAADSAVTVEQIGPYLVDGKLPVCPAGGSYTLGRIGEPPTCSYSGHVLP